VGGASPSPARFAGRTAQVALYRRWALPGGGAELGAGVGAWATQVALGVLAGGADVRVQPEPASLRRPQLLPVALRHPGHPDPRTFMPPGPLLLVPGPGPPPCGSRTHGSGELIHSSLRSPIRFIMTIRRLGRVSWPCRSRYATTAAPSRPTGHRRRPDGEQSGVQGHLCEPPPNHRGRRCPSGENRRLTCKDRSRGGVQQAWGRVTLPVIGERTFAG
jgi:hypothetical protein